MIQTKFSQDRDQTEHQSREERIAHDLPSHGAFRSFFQTQENHAEDDEDRSHGNAQARPLPEKQHGNGDPEQRRGSHDGGCSGDAHPFKGLHQRDEPEGGLNQSRQQKPADPGQVDRHPPVSPTTRCFRTGEIR